MYQPKLQQTYINATMHCHGAIDLLACKITVAGSK